MISQDSSWSSKLSLSPFLLLTLSTRRVLNVTATDGQHFADVMPIEIILVDTEGYHADTSLNGENSAFECQDTGVAQRLGKILQQAEKNNRGKEDFPPTYSRYLANIHYPVFQRIPQSFYVNETASIGSTVFQASIHLLLKFLGTCNLASVCSKPVFISFICLITHCYPSSRLLT